MSVNIKSMLVKYDNSKKLVVQHKKLINARFDMNLNQLRIFVYMLLQIKKEDTEFRPIRIPCAMIHGSKKKVRYDEIIKHAKEFAHKRIEVEHINEKNKKSWTSVGLIGTVRYTEHDGYIIANFSNDAAPLLLNLSENFRSVKYERFCNLSSLYSYRLFWLLVQFEDTGFFDVKVKDLKEMLYLEKKYPYYANFKSRVIVPAQKDLGENGFPFEFEEDKCGSRKVQKLKFIFSKKLEGRVKKVKKKEVKDTIKVQSVQSQIDFNHNRTTIIDAEVVPGLDQVSRWMMHLGLSISEIDYYKKHIDEKSLKKSVYGLYNKWYGSSMPLLEIHKISKECLNELIGSIAIVEE